jgi:RNA polymerase sigma-70 factor (TIGR02960 family)
MMTATLIERAQTGDAEAFRRLVDPHRSELRVHCYRMLASLQDAEDALQETLLAAWHGLSRYEGRASLRTWLYTVATNQCLNARRAAKRRPAKAYDVPGVEPPPATQLGEVTWLEPFPDALLPVDVSLGPDVRYEQRESVSLSFLTGLQRLPPRQLAVLVLRDVLGFEASEVSAMLESSVDAVNSALKRARAQIEASPRQDAERPLAPYASGAAQLAIANRFAHAWESADMTALVALLSDDVFVSMPPIPNEYRGRDIVTRFLASIFQAGRRFDLVPTRANGIPAFGAYLRTPECGLGVGLYVLEPRGEQVCALTRFEAHVLEWFGLPAQLPLR